MTKLNRVTGKVFGGDATATGDNPEIGQFGSALAGTYNGTTDVATIQSLSAWGQGWAGAVTPDTNFPALPEMTGFGKVLSYQNNYVLQSGVPEYDEGTIYYTNDFCRVGNVLYYSLTDDNQANDPTTDTTNWTVYDDKFMPFNSTTNRVLKLTGLTYGTATQTSGSTTKVDMPVTVSAGSSFLMPNGRNEDGSLNNIVYTLDEDITGTLDSLILADVRVLFIFSGGRIQSYNNIQTYYVNKATDLPTTTPHTYLAVGYALDTNKWYYSPSGSTTDRTWNEITACPIGIYTVPAIGSVPAHTDFYPAQFLTQNDNWWLSGIGMPSNRYIDLTLGASGTTYTAPANGWFAIRTLTLSTNAIPFFQIRYGERTIGITESGNQSYSNETIMFILPCIKGTVVTVYYAYVQTGDDVNFKFIYADGTPSA